MYRLDYISCFSDDIYLRYLQDPSLLEELADQYLAKYSDQANAFYLALKESLDHYVSMKLALDKEYAHTEEFYQYTLYLRYLVSKNIVECQSQQLFMEPTVNVVFSYLPRDLIQKINPQKPIQEEMSHNQEILSSIFYKIQKSIIISEEELNLISIYFDARKPLQGGLYGQFMHYVCDHLTDFKATPELISSMLSYFPQFYGEGVENTRMFLASKDCRFDGGKVRKVSCAHSSFNHPYVAFNFECFSQIRLNAFGSIDFSRVSKNQNDIIFLLFTAFHELSHQRLKNELDDSPKFEAAAYEIKMLLNYFFKDYRSRGNIKGNHDSDENEIDADERGWAKCSAFLTRFMRKYEETKELSEQCLQNMRDVNLRRIFSYKKDPKSGELSRYMDYDIKKVQEVIRMRPEALDLLTQLSRILTKDGNFNLDLLFQEVIASVPVGREFCNYILSNVSEENIEDYLRKGNYSLNQIFTLFENFFEVMQFNSNALVKINKTNLDTYDNTKSFLNIKEQKDIVNNLYFIEFAQQFFKISKLLNYVYQKNPEVSAEKVERLHGNILSCYKQMLNTIENPNFYKIEQEMIVYEQSGNPYFVELAKQTRDYLEKFVSPGKELSDMILDSSHRQEEFDIDYLSRKS